MANILKRKVTRRGLLKAGALLTASPIIARVAGPSAVHAAAKPPTKVLGFLTYADVAKAEQEGGVAYYGHDSEQAIATLLGAFRKDFPKIKTSYVRLQTGALYAKLLSERSAGTYQVDILDLSDVAPAMDFQKRGGYMQYTSPEAAAYKPEYLSNPAGYYFWAGVTFAGIGYNTTRLKAEDAPKNWKDILNPKYAGVISAKLSTSGTQDMQWYMLRKLYGNDFWKEFAKLKPHGFDSRSQLFDRLAKGEDEVCALAEYAGHVFYKDKGANIEFVAPPDGLPATPVVVGIVDKAPHPEAAKLFLDWGMSRRGQTVWQDEKILLYPSLRSDATPLPTGKRLQDFKLLFPSDWADYNAAQNEFVKEWNGIMGL